MILMITIATLAVLRTTAGHQDIGLPKFSWIWTRSGISGDRSLLSILFSDGTEDFVKFSSRQTLGSSCLWQGYFLGESDVSVTASGPCPLRDTFEITVVASQRLPGQMFQVSNGQVRKIEPSDKLGTNYIKTVNARSDHQRQQVTPTKAFPPEGFTVDVRLYADDKLRDVLGNATDTTMLMIMGHAETWFQHPSLTTTISFNVVQWLKYDGSLDTTDANMDLLEKMRKPRGDAINVFFTYDELNVGAKGIANLEGYCEPQGAIAIVEYEGETLTGLVTAHEVGHVLGMKHDFEESNRNVPRYDRNGQSCLMPNKIMNYGNARNQWSTCSVEDLLAAYNGKPCFKKKSCEDKPFCLEELTTVLKHFCNVAATALSCPKSCKKC